jgi:hypothetical protein
MILQTADMLLLSEVYSPEYGAKFDKNEDTVMKIWSIILLSGLWHRAGLPVDTFRQKMLPILSVEEILILKISIHGVTTKNFDNINTPNWKPHLLNNNFEVFSEVKHKLRSIVLWHWVVCQVINQDIRIIDSYRHVENISGVELQIHLAHHFVCVRLLRH